VHLLTAGFGTQRRSNDVRSYVGSRGGRAGIGAPFHFTSLGLRLSSTTRAAEAAVSPMLEMKPEGDNACLHSF
jgi:hypothetical protein